MAKEKHGIFISRSWCWFSIFAVAALMLAEGLIVGLVGRSSCEIVDPSTTTPAAKPTTTFAPTEAPLLEVWENPRLPKNLIPSHYTVDLRPDLELDPASGTYWFYGSSEVVYYCEEPTDTIVLHHYKLNQTAEPILVDQYGNSVTIEESFFYVPNNYQVLKTSERCQKDMSYNLTYPSFNGELSDDLVGIYRSEYNDENGQKRVIATVHFQKYGARKTFPCFDEPGFKASFLFTIKHRNEYIATGNMPINLPIEEITLDNGETWNSTTFYVTPVMPTYAIGICVTDFAFEDAETKDGITTRIYARKVPVARGEVKYAAELTPVVLDYYAELFNYPYPLPKSDQMCVPDFGAGATENWGLVLYRETYLLYDDNISTPGNLYTVTSVISHELTHMWFGNLVTCEWWSEFWLNEGFATYFSYLGVKAVQPSWNTDEYFVIDDLQSALAYDDTSYSYPLSSPYSYYSSTIVYAKGASILRMINGFLGTETFLNGLTNYLNELEYGTTTYNLLFAEWIQQAESEGVTFPYPLQDILETWTIQMGYPLLTVSRDSDTNNIIVSQEVFLMDPEDTPGEPQPGVTYNSRWYVPFTYKTAQEVSSGADGRYVWMNLDDDIVIDDTDYIIGNLDAVGFYRVNYDADMWSKIAAKLQSPSYNDISTQNRAQLLDDAFALQRATILDVETVLELTLVLEQDHEYITWYTFEENIGFYDRMFSSSEIYGEFSKYILDMAVPNIYEYYGLDDSDKTKDKLFDRFARGVGVDIACHYGHPDCISSSVTLFAEWMEDTSKLIGSSYRSSAYCAAIAAGGVKEWDFLYEQYLITDSAQHRTSMRFGLACSKDAWIINRYLDRTLDTNIIRIQDRSSTLAYIGQMAYNKYTTWSWAVTNWDKIMDSIGDDITSLLSYVKNRFSTNFDLALIEDLKEVAGSGWYSTLNSYANTVRDNMDWRLKNEKKVATWLGITSYKVDEKALKVQNRPERSSGLMEPLKEYSYLK